METRRGKLTFTFLKNLYLYFLFSVEYPLKKEPQDGTGECKLRLVAYAGSEWFDIVAESTIHEQICIHHDLDKKSATFSRRLK